MALWFHLKVNNTVIKTVEIVRQFPTGQPREGQTCLYTWRVYEPGETDPDEGRVEFPYGDAVGLVQTALAAYQVVRTGRRYENGIAGCAGGEPPH